MNNSILSIKFCFIFSVLLSAFTMESNAQDGLDYSMVQAVQYVGPVEYSNSHESKKTSGAFVFHLYKQSKTFAIYIVDRNNSNNILFSLSANFSNISPMINDSKFNGLEIIVDGITYRLFKAGDLELEFRIENPMRDFSDSYFCECSWAKVSFFYNNENKSRFTWSNDIMYFYFPANDKFNSWLDYLYTLIK